MFIRMILQGHVMSHVSSSAFKCLQISSKIYCNRYVPKSICKINKVGVWHQTITYFLSDLENSSLCMDILFNFLDSLFWSYINIHQISVSKFHALPNTSTSFKEFIWMSYFKKCSIGPKNLFRTILCDLEKSRK